LPINVITGTPNRHVDVQGRWYERLLTTTQQPNLSGAGTATARPLSPQKKSIFSRKSRVRPPQEDEVRIPETKIVALDGMGQVDFSRALKRSDLVMPDDEIRGLPCFHLSERFGHFSIPSPFQGSITTVFQDKFSWTTQSMHLERGESGQPERYLWMTRAGPRENLHFDPHDPVACAAIVSCGGICPGLNSVIREVVNTLWAYGCRRIYGIRGGYKGVTTPDEWMVLTPESVHDIHTQGGTILVSDRGNPPEAEMARVLKEKGVKQYFVLGGDGTHRGAMKSFDACLELDHECAVIGVPKTIDNDVPVLDQTFVFDTACTEAEKAVDSAYVEATCNANCIGLVKLMGRHCGFVAMDACLAARHVDICLLPEMQIDIERCFIYCAPHEDTKVRCHCCR